MRFACILTIRMALGMILIMSIGSFCHGQPERTDIPDAEKGTGVDERLGDMIDLDIEFRDDQNRKVRIGDFFDGKQPVILSFNYSNCPKLCSVQLENMAMALRKIDFTAKDDFQIISVSIDPLEQVASVRKSKEKYLMVYGNEKTADGWHFLVGKRNSIEVLADDCGFRYKYIRHQKLYSHPPVFILLSPKGKIVRYIHGLNYEPITIKRALVEAAEGKIGSSINRFTYITGCYLYDETSGKYSSQVMGIMRLGGICTLVLLLGGLVPYWFMGTGKKSTPRGPAAANDQNLENKLT